MRRRLVITGVIFIRFYIAHDGAGERMATELIRHHGMDGVRAGFAFPQQCRCPLMEKGASGRRKFSDVIAWMVGHDATPKRTVGRRDAAQVEGVALGNYKYLPAQIIVKCNGSSVSNASAHKRGAMAWLQVEMLPPTWFP